jgi:Cytochrome bd terminal oxidase subunit I
MSPAPALISHLSDARAQMGTSLAFHLVFALLGVGLPLMMLIAEGMHLRTGDPVWRALALRWSKVFAVLFAVGAVSGTIISFELGLLFPRFMAAALWALRARRYAIARVAAALGAIAIVWGWGLAQYPRLAGGLTVRSAAASSPELTAVAVALAAGAVLLAPALWLLYVAFRRQPIEVTPCSEA